jgi:hypothetical protein
MVSRFSPAGPAVKNIAGCVNRRKCHLTEPEAGPATSQSIGVQSIEVGLLLLRPLLDAGSPLTLKAIAGAVSFAPPKAHRYLVSLIRSGLVERHRSSGHYQLGPLAVELGFAAIGRLDRDGWGREAVDELALETGVTSCSVAWVNGTAVVTAVELGMDTIFAGVRLGTRLCLRARIAQLFTQRSDGPHRYRRVGGAGDRACRGREDYRADPRQCRRNDKGYGQPGYQRGVRSGVRSQGQPNMCVDDTRADEQV